ncbi:MAG: prepilin-type N-terminal cleavage/methylation domain-containing protein [Planctomycetota bacterium]
MTTKRKAFSLIELVVVIVILGLLATIAIPRMSRGAEGAAAASLRSDLAVLRNAVELYKAEHEGNVPTLANMPNALLQYTDISGTVSATPTSTAIYGPYLAAVPTMKIGARKGLATIAAPTDTSVAWHYDQATGRFTANVAGTDASGVNYADY